jgi:hypothetical protein
MVAVPVPLPATRWQPLNHARRSIFLHFVNRELLFLRRAGLNEAEHIALLKTSALMSAGHLVAPFAQVSELYHNSSALKELVSALAGVDKLHMTNGAADYYSFRESRRELYGSRQSPYGMYFGRREHFKDLYSKSPTLNTTNYIRDYIVRAISNPDELRGNLISMSEVRRLELNADWIRQSFQASKSAATFSIFEVQDISPKPQEVRFFGELSCRLYISHYSTEHEIVAPTGFMSDDKIEDYNHFPVFDLPLCRTLFNRIGLSLIIEDVQFHKPLLDLIMDPDFDEFCRQRDILFTSITRAVGKQVASFHSRYEFEEFLLGMDFGAPSTNSPTNAISLATKLRFAMRQAASKNRAFQDVYKEFDVNSVINRFPAIFTATELEHEIFLSSAAIHGFSFFDLSTFPGLTASLYRRTDDDMIWYVRTSAGSSGAHGSARLSEIAIDALKPSVILSVGVGFGTKPDTQNLVMSSSLSTLPHMKSRKCRQRP